jgi:prepilin-type N-terminal cleavage/methylation domain-containing protein
MNFKSRKEGFSFVEVVIALTVMGLVITALLGLQANLLKGLVASTGRIQRGIAIKNFWFSRLRSGEPTGEQTLQDPPIKLRFEMRPTTENSSLHKIPDIVLQRIEAQWQQQSNTKTELAMSMVYKPEEKHDQTRL